MTYEEHFCLFLVPGVLDDANVQDKITTSEYWTTNVRDVLRKIGSSRVGIALLRSIKHVGIVITIEPYYPISTANPVCGASTLGGQLGPIVKYTPERYGHGTACEEKWILKGGFVPTRDEILFHELVHAFRTTSQDSSNYVPFNYKGLSFYESAEEFYAVLLQNIYESELRQPIRASLNGSYPIDKYLEGSYLFFQSGSQTYDLVATLCDQNRGFTKAISKIHTRFNPIRAYYENPKKAKEYSNSEMAKTRDNLAPYLYVSNKLLGFYW